MKSIKGYSLVELMIATTLATIMSLGVLGIFINQTGSINTETQRDITAQEANYAFDQISRLLRQSIKSSININYPTGESLNPANAPELPSDAIIIDFLLPSGYNIWPNTKEPFINNAIRIKWNNNTSSPDANQIQIALSDSISNLGSAPLNTLVGSNAGDHSRIINLDIWPMLDARNTHASSNATGNAGYLLKITTRSANKDLNYINSEDPDGPLKQFRTHTVSGIIFPRN